jgi:phenylacetate-coenzyme A ligase PaaK-like adenylate-forming protein
MADHYDGLETRDPDARERDLFARVSEIVARALTAPGWAGHLAGLDPASVTSRAALARLPLLRKSDLVALQKAHPPFGGLNVTPAGKVRRLLMSPGPIFEPQGFGADIYGVARALLAAGFRPGDVVHNSFSYHLTPGAFIFESGLFSLGCAVIPGGVGNTEMQIDAIAHLAPTGYAGTPDFLKVLLDGAEKSGKDASSLKRGLVSGAALPASLRQEFAARGLEVLQCYAIAEVGVIAYESAARDGMIVNEQVIVEIVRPGTGDPVADGEVGEVVVTSFNPDYPMIRLATGDLSAALPGRSSCGRTNMRIQGWMGRADQTAKVRGMFVHPGQVAEVARRHPALARVRLAITRAAEQDEMTLLAECAMPAAGLAQEIAATVQSVTKLRAGVTLVPAGSLPNDGKLISDERSPT